MCSTACRLTAARITRSELFCLFYLVTISTEGLTARQGVQTILLVERYRQHFGLVQYSDDNCERCKDRYAFIIFQRPGFTSPLSLNKLFQESNRARTVMFMQSVRVSLCNQRPIIIYRITEFFPRHLLEVQFFKGALPLLYFG